MEEFVIYKEMDSHALVLQGLQEKPVKVGILITIYYMAAIVRAL